MSVVRLLSRSVALEMIELLDSLLHLECVKLDDLVEVVQTEHQGAIAIKTFIIFMECRINYIATLGHRLKIDESFMLSRDAGL